MRAPHLDQVLAYARTTAADEGICELTRLGCAKGQGWYFGRAASAADTERLLADRGLLRAPIVPPTSPDTGSDADGAEPLRKSGYGEYLLGLLDDR